MFFASIFALKTGVEKNLNLHSLNKDTKMNCMKYFVQTPFLVGVNIGSQ